MTINDTNYAYRQLVVWQKAMELVKLVYGQIRLLPSEERFALADQLRRAVTSIPSNIAEGNGRASNKDYAHFLAIARGSLFETMTQLEIAESLGYITVSQDIAALAVEIRRMLGSMLQKYGAYHCQPQPQPQPQPRPLPQPRDPSIIARVWTLPFARVRQGQTYLAKSRLR